MKKEIKFNNNPIPVRLDNDQFNWLSELQDKTKLSKSFIIRRCISLALKKFLDEEVNILTLKEQ